MAVRRELLPILLAAAFLLLGPAQALAAPQWLAPENRNASFPFSVAPDVASDADGNAVAVWLDQNRVAAAFRPRGGAWQSAVANLEPAFPLNSLVAPRVVARPDGSFVAVWAADRTGGSDPVLRSATRSASGTWTTEDVRDLSCCTQLDGLHAGGDGSVMAISQEATGSVSSTKPPGNGPWGAIQGIGLGVIDDFAVAADGSATAVGRGVGVCGGSNCLRAAHRSPGGAWGPQEQVAITAGLRVTGLALAAKPDASFTVVWGDETFNGQTAGPPRAVLSADRSAGSAGTWSGADTVVDLPLDVPGCNFGCFDLATGPDGAQLAVWQQTGASGSQLAAAIRSPGGAWGGAQTAGATGGGATPYAAVTTTRVPVVAWSDSGPNLALARASHRDTAGVWHSVDLDSSQDDSVYLGDVAADGDGNALTAWKHRGGVFTAGFDGAGPRFSAFSLPAGNVVQAPFSAAADDNWSPLASIAWLFGDGAGAPGASVSHEYGAAGTFTATATATDAIGNATALSGTVAVTAEPTPTPDPCGTADKDKDGIKDGCDTNDGSKRPVAFKTVNATVVSGDVFVKLPAGAARASQAKPPKGFVRLEGAETIPVGSTLDTAKGRVSLRTASDTRKHVQTAQFFRGRFLIRQVRRPRRKGQKKRSTKLTTELRLTGSSFSKTCPRAKASISAKRRSKKRVRRLFGDGKGSFRTRGRNAAATVRGTAWSVQDRCDGTLVTVQRGRVSVRDLVKHKTVTVRTGHTYLARRR